MTTMKWISLNLVNDIRKHVRRSDVVTKCSLDRACRIEFYFHSVKVVLLFISFGRSPALATGLSDACTFSSVFFFFFFFFCYRGRSVSASSNKRSSLSLFVFLQEQYRFFLWSSAEIISLFLQCRFFCKLLWELIQLFPI